jgi:hypothetical protein
VSAELLEVVQVLESEIAGRVDRRLRFVMGAVRFDIHRAISGEHVPLRFADEAAVAAMHGCVHLRTHPFPELLGQFRGDFVG